MKSITASSGARWVSTPAARRLRTTARGPASQACELGAGGFDRPPARPRAGGELRHLQKFQRLGELVGIDARGGFEFADGSLCERREPRKQRTQLQPRAGPRARHGVGCPRRKQRALPLAVAGPAADAGAADAGLGRDLTVRQRGLLNEPAHRRDLRVRMGTPRHARPRTDDGRWPLRRRVGPWADADNGGRGIFHVVEYNPIAAPGQSPPRAHRCMAAGPD